MTITHIPTGKTREIEITVIPKMESIVQGFRDTDLPDGEYTVYKNAPKLSDDELALLCDSGNLCFGYKKSGVNEFYVYED